MHKSYRLQLTIPHHIGRIISKMVFAFGVGSFFGATKSWYPMKSLFEELWLEGPIRKTSSIF